ncbi:EAL domain-containing protein [Noviherbaspirillum humi]|uniref:EAL domain-containing protein n=1 Tax=Noviherbaspirillum humi TaxID=1688639 RepID=UPI0015951C29|nr:EAL domain-containing protein [Noviherbaspirillum humi]
MSADEDLKARLMECEQRLQFLSQFSSDWYWEQDAEFRFTHISRNSLSEERFPRSLSIGKRRWDLPYVGITEAEWEAHRALLRAHQPFHDFILKRYDTKGNLYYTSLSGAPFYDGDGNFKGYRGIGRDVTKRKQMEQQAALEHAVVRVITEASDVVSALPRILQAICETLDWDYGAYWGAEGQNELIRQLYVWHVPDLAAERFVGSGSSWVASRENAGGNDGDVVRKAWLGQQPVSIQNLSLQPAFQRAGQAQELGLRTAFAFPVVIGDRTHGVMEFYSRTMREVEASLLASLTTVGNQIGLFCQRKQLESRQVMQHIVTRLLSESDTVEVAMPAIIQTVCQTLGWDYGGYWCMDTQTRMVNCRALWSIDRLTDSSFVQQTRQKAIFLSRLTNERNAGHLGTVWRERIPVWVADIGATLEYRHHRTRLGAESALHSIFAFPIVDGQEVLGALEFFSRTIRQPDDTLLETAQAIGIQVGQFHRRKEAEERIQYLAFYDALTGLPNRPFFVQQLNHALAKARRSAARLALLFIDVDRFKHINDSLGHEAGDQLLAEMASRFKACIRESDTVGRLGGDEFVILLEGIKDAREAAVVSRKINEAALRPFTIGAQEYQVSASIGISLYPDNGDNAQVMMKHADIAMYQTKESGKNHYQFYSPQIDRDASSRLAMEAELRQALERNQLRLHYQPKVSLDSGRISGMEALLRWAHPELGMVPPSVFIPLAEETGMIESIGAWVLQEACAQSKRWENEGLPPLRISVNLSPRQFNSEDLIADIAQALIQHQLQPGVLELEITESTVTRNAEKAARVLARVQAMGVSVAIDDFGTGYSSLSQLKHFPINTLKIDRSFIADVTVNRANKAIVRAVVAMGKALGLNLVAEGVESDEQMQFLQSVSCNEVQGSYFSGPLPPREFAELLRQDEALLRH